MVAFWVFWGGRAGASRTKLVGYRAVTTYRLVDDLGEVVDDLDRRELFEQ